jgi:hypothetical protein
VVAHVGVGSLRQPARRPLLAEDRRIERAQRGHVQLRDEVEDLFRLRIDGHGSPAITRSA